MTIFCKDRKTVRVNLTIVAATTILIAGCEKDLALQEENVTLAEESIRLTEQKATQKSLPLFSETENILPAGQRARRKWDGAIVGDLDGNGFQDLILTEHAYKVRVFWNEGGSFSGPQDLISGDMHGLSIADLDNDGLIDVLVAQGGGAGTNPRKPKHFEITKAREFEGGDVLEHFEKGRGRSAKVFDANNDGELDLFLTGFPTPEQAEMGANHLYKNTGNGQFEFLSHQPFGHRLSYRSTITDINSDGIADILTFGGHNIVAALGGEGFDFVDKTEEALGELQDIGDVSAISQIDFDRDGDFDLVLSRAEHQFEHETYYDPENKRFAFFARFQSLQVDDLTIDGDFRLENLQMAFPHFDVFVGENKRLLALDENQEQAFSYDSDREGSTGINLTRDEAQGWPDNLCIPEVQIDDLPEDSAPGLYIGHLGEGVWRICSQTKSPTAGVVHNVISTPTVTEDESLPAVLLENRSGVFVDVSEKMGIAVNEQTTSVATADFNNDGWTDLFFVRYGDMSKENEQIVYLNNQGKSFDRQENHGAISMDLGATGSGAEVIDYDRDGDMDIIYANERGTWHLLANNTEALSDNNFIGIHVGKSPSGKATALGAMAEVVACNKSNKRLVGQTASSFGVTLNTDLHFGLGECDRVERVRVSWTNGESVELYPQEVNQYVDVGK